MKLYKTPQIKITCLMNQDCIRTSGEATADPYGFDTYDLSSFN